MLFVHRGTSQKHEGPLEKGPRQAQNIWKKYAWAQSRHAPKMQGEFKNERATKAKQDKQNKTLKSQDEAQSDPK